MGERDLTLSASRVPDIVRSAAVAHAHAHVRGLAIQPVTCNRLIAPEARG